MTRSELINMAVADLHLAVTYAEDGATSTAAALARSAATKLNAASAIMRRLFAQQAKAQLKRSRKEGV